MPDAIFDQSCDTDVSSRALVPLTLAAKAATAPSPAIRPDARFVVQLMANANARTLAQHGAGPQDVATTYSDVSVRGEFRLVANGLALARVA